jgi:membrane protease YdiL (CAAX protease family)
MADEEEDEATREPIVLLAIVVEGGLILAAWVLGWMLDQPPLRKFQWTVQGGMQGVAAVVPMLALFWVLNRWPVGPLADIKDFTNRILCPMLAPCTVVDLLGISVLAGLGEELLFRGVLQETFSRALPPALALLAASVLFGLVHAVTPTYAVLASLSGLYLGWLFLATDNLLVPVIAHALYDFGVLLYLLRGPGWEPVEEDGEPPSSEDEGV